MNKREISKLEKQSVQDTSQYALTFLGYECLEIAELVEIGFAPSKIIGIDYSSNAELNLQSIANIKYARATYKGIHTWNRPFDKFWKNIGYKFSYSYIHLDFCSQASENMLRQCLLPIDNLISGARLRVTFSESLARLSVNRRGDRYCYEQLQQFFKTYAYGRLKLVGSIPYISSEEHREPYRSTWFDKL